MLALVSSDVSTSPCGPVSNVSPCNFLRSNAFLVCSADKPSAASGVGATGNGAGVGVDEAPPKNPI